MAIDYQSGYVDVADGGVDNGEDIGNYLQLPDDASVAQMIEASIKLFVYFPGASDYRYRILTSILICSSRVSMKLGHILFHGKSGCGKSNAVKVCRAVRGETELLNPGSTAVGLRNWINKNKYWDTEKLKPKDTTFMGFDNVHAGTFQLNEKLSEMMQWGYCRTTDLIVIGGAEDGGNKEFHCFCLKGLSSVHALWKIPDLAEIGRRLYVFTLERAPIEDFEAIGEPEEFDWSRVSDSLTRFWWDSENLSQFAKLRRNVRSRKNLWVGYDAAWKDITICPITAGLLAGVWENPKDAATDWLAFWQSLANTGTQSPTQQHIAAFLDALPGYLRAVDFREEWVLPTKQLQQYLSPLWDSGALDEKPTTKNLTVIMTEFGFELEIRGWVYKPVC